MTTTTRCASVVTFCLPNYALARSRRSSHKQSGPRGRRTRTTPLDAPQAATATTATAAEATVTMTVEPIAVIATTARARARARANVDRPPLAICRAAPCSKLALEMIAENRLQLEICTWGDDQLPCKKFAVAEYSSTPLVSLQHKKVTAANDAKSARFGLCAITTSARTRRLALRAASTRIFCARVRVVDCGERRRRRERRWHRSSGR